MSLGIHFGGCDRAGYDTFLEVVDGRCAMCGTSIHLLVDSQRWESDNVTLPLNSHGKLADGSQLYREARWKLKLHSWVNS